ncbi:Transcriptional adapter 2B [Clonorchis sinensis]|uniref:Transcriptional adapter 2B n=1 Tax=Clonorchis sinensis TaxID=79923 RepID=A0A8T1MMU5_CLOSI|nr:Transcriptional adapter 2B [Clonorchis sinensis]
MQQKPHKCAYCLQKLTEVCVLCIECNPVRLCINCFLCGAESGAHKKSHAYTLELFQSVPSDCLFSSHCDWSSEEEQRLLDAVETYGYGNWHEVSTQLPSRTAADCQHHFDQFYVFGAIGRHTIGKDNERSGVTLDHTVDDIGERCVTSLDLRPDEQKIIGYMPCRDEFEYEYSNNAEHVLVSVPYSFADGLETDLRLALVAIYNKHLADRHWRHQIAREHGLIPLLVRRLVEPHRRMNHFCYRPTGRFRVYGGPVQRKRRAGVSFTSRCRRKGSGRLVSNASSHFHRQSKFLTQLPELSEHSFVDYSGPHRLLTCDHVQSNRSLINTSLCTSCSDSGVLHVPFTCSTNEPCTAAQQSTTALQNSLPESDKLQPGVFTSSKSMGASLGSYNRFKKTSPTMSGKSSADALCFSSFSRCLGISSHTTSDSGIGSCDSCAQSTISTGSMNGDPFTYACSSGTPTTRLPLGRRPRSNSDSVYVSGSLFPGRKRSSELLANLQELRHQSESTPSLVHAVEPPAWVTDDKPSGSLNAVAQAALPSSQIASKATVKRRGRPLRRQSKRPCRPSSVSKLGNTTSDEYPTWMKPFLRFMTQQEARRFVVNLERESTLRSELAQLRDHHRKGVRSMTNVELRSSIRPNPPSQFSHNGSAFQTRCSNGRAMRPKTSSTTKRMRNSSIGRRRSSYFTRPSKRVSRKSSTVSRNSRPTVKTGELPAVRKRGRPPKQRGDI